MLLKRIFLFVLFLGLLNELKSNVHIYESNNKISIKVVNNSPELKHLDSVSILTIADSEKYLSSFGKDNDAFSFQFASSNEIFEYDIKINSEKVIPFEFNSSNIDNYYKTISNASKIRGIKINELIFAPFRYDRITNSIFYAETFEITITHKDEIPKSSTINFGRETPFFEQIINPLQLQTLIDSRNSDKNKIVSPDLLKSDWYNPEIDYIKIETTSDEIVKVKMQEIIDLIPQISGKSSQFIHLLYRGVPYPYIILNDDGIISGNDEIIFYGRRPAGDTTWFDTYTNNEVFFLFFDEANIGFRFSEMNPNSNEVIEYSSVKIDRHYEEDKFYSHGSEFESYYFDGSIEKSFFYDTRTIRGEGWFWSIIAPQNFQSSITKPKFSKYIMIDPSDNPEDNITVSLWYRTNQDSIRRENRPIVPTYYDLRLYINGNQRDRDSLMGFHWNSLDYISNGNNFINGLNNIEIESRQIYIETNERTNVDFIKVVGNIKPASINDAFDFSGKHTDMKLTVPGFRSSNLLGFDIENNKFSTFNSTDKGTLFRVSGSLEGTVSGSIGINDSLIYLSQAGIHILAERTDGNYDYRHFTGSDIEHNQYINSISNGSSIAVLIINDGTISSNFTSLQGLGSQRFSDISSGKVYCGAFIKSNDFFIERISDVKVGMTEFISHSVGKRFNHSIAVESNSESKFILCGFDNISNAVNISRVNKSNLRNSEKLDVVFISHGNFIKEAERLADYRRKTLGMSIEVVDADDIYKEFSYGRKSPHGIKDFLKYTYEQRDITHVLLIGDASWDSRKLLEISHSTNWIPTYGFPVSDWWYSCLDGEDDVRPEFVIGRLPVNSSEQANNYIDKVIEYENTPESPWMKNILFLIGGYNIAEINRFRGMIGLHYHDRLLNPPLCATYSSVIKDVDGPSTSSQGGEIREQINKGAMWTIYIGHAAAEIFDLDGWNVSSLNNKGRYGNLTTISCNTGAFAEPQLVASRNEMYILEKDKGFVTATGGSFTGFVGSHNIIATRMMAAIADPARQMRFVGDLMVYGKAVLAPVSNDQFSTLHTFALLGDPLVRARIGTEPDAYLFNNSIQIQNENGTSRFTDKDNYVNISGKIYNYGYKIDAPFKIRIVRENNSARDTIWIDYEDLCYFDDFNFSFEILNMPGRHRITIDIDPDNEISELTKDNNKLVINIDVFKESLLALDPQPYWNISSNKPKFRVINPLKDGSEFDYYFLLTSNSDTNSVIHHSNSRDNSDVIISENFIDWKPDFNLSEDSYWFHVRYINKTNSTWSGWTSIPVNSSIHYEQNKVSASISSKEEFLTGKIDDLMLDESAGQVKLSMRRDTIPFRALGVKGNRPGNPEGQPVVEAHVNLEAGDEVFVDGPHDIGINVATVKSRSGELITRYKRFDTWGEGTPYPAEKNFMFNDISRELVEFLRDSVEDDDYVLIATNKSSFRIPYLYKMYGEDGDHGSIDSLLYYFKSFGSLIADTLNFDADFNGEQVSFAMVGWRGAEVGSIPEAINFNGDTAFVSGNLILFSPEGNYKSDFINKSKKWNSITIESEYPDNGTNIGLFVAGRNSETGNIDTLLHEVNPGNVDMSQINAIIYPEVFASLKFSQTKFDIKSLLNSDETFISSIRLEFVPADELAILQSETDIDKNDILKGEPVGLNLAIENISLRTKTDSADISVNVSRGGTDNNFTYYSIFNLEPNSKFEFIQDINTDFLDRNNSIDIKIDNDEKLVEFFTFNNSVTLPLRTVPDTVKPRILIKIDGKYHTYGDYISIMPLVEVELHDNSPMTITDSTSLTVRINGFLHPYQRTLFSEFIPVNDGTSLKAIFRFIPDTLQFEDASIIVYARDNEGNRDTLTTLARLSLLNAFVEDVFTYPNPARDIVNFSLTYKAPDHGLNSTLEIYDLSGNKIDEISKELSLGTNIFQWNGRYLGSSSVSSGIYVYRIKYNGNFYVEPVYGKFMIIR
ncbi:MAG: T9SS type A sorting domain-containing protein [Candidatus Kapabacteria bacterium]|nr:T9SS type A sorting domain-containing protein [Ignavibacteriota bacterium]MCW5883496.1 T9SS type A sorting domain-containing protein [Candidatus Kapabacteria bacterium]